MLITLAVLLAVLAELSFERPFECRVFPYGYFWCNYYHICFDDNNTAHILAADPAKATEIFHKGGPDRPGYPLAPSAHSSLMRELRAAFESPAWLQKMRSNEDFSLHEFPSGAMWMQQHAGQDLHHVYHGGQRMLGFWDYIINVLPGLGNDGSYPTPPALVFLGTHLHHGRFQQGVFEVMASGLAPMTLKELQRLRPKQFNARMSLMQSWADATSKGAEASLRSFRNLSQHILHPALFHAGDFDHGGKKHWLICFPNSTTVDSKKGMVTCGSDMPRGEFLRRAYKIYNETIPRFPKRASDWLVENRKITVALITRSRRGIVNAAELLAELHSKNNTKFPFEIIISSHGAELGNIYFMKYPACVIEVIPAGFLHSESQQFTNLARYALIGHFRYRALPYNWNFTHNPCAKKWLDDPLGARMHDVHCFQQLYKHSFMLVDVPEVMQLVRMCVETLGGESFPLHIFQKALFPLDPPSSLVKVNDHSHRT
eukprot:g10194.t1